MSKIGKYFDNRSKGGENVNDNMLTNVNNTVTSTFDGKNRVNNKNLKIIKEINKQTRYKEAANNKSSVITENLAWKKIFELKLFGSGKTKFRILDFGNIKGEKNILKYQYLPAYEGIINKLSIYGIDARKIFKEGIEQYKISSEWDYFLYGSSYTMGYYGMRDISIDDLIKVKVNENVLGAIYYTKYKTFGGVAITLLDDDDKIRYLSESSVKWYSLNKSRMSNVFRRNWLNRKVVQFRVWVICDSKILSALSDKYLSLCLNSAHKLDSYAVEKCAWRTQVWLMKNHADLGKWT